MFYFIYGRLYFSEFRYLIWLVSPPKFDSQNDHSSQIINMSPFLVTLDGIPSYVTGHVISSETPSRGFQVNLYTKHTTFNTSKAYGLSHKSLTL